MRWWDIIYKLKFTSAVDPNLTTAQSHHITEHLRHDAFPRRFQNLTEIVAHVETLSESHD